MATGEVILVGLIGLAAGLLGGLAGIGGSLVMLPALAALNPDDSAHHLHMAAAMAVNVFVAVPATLRHHKAGAIRRDLVRTLLPVMSIAIIAGVLVSNLLEGRSLKMLLAIFIAAYCLNNLLHLARRTPEHDGDGERVSRLRLALIGGFVGMVAGLLGIGGGVLMVPLLQVVCRIRLRHAIAASAAVMCLTATVGATMKVATLPHLGQSPLDAMWLVLAMGPAAVLGATVGAMLTHALPVRIVRLAVSLLLLVAAARLAGLF